MTARGNDTFRYGAILLTVCLISASALTVVYRHTLPAVRATAAANLLKLKSEVLPAAETFRAVDGLPGVDEGFDAGEKSVGKTASVSARGYGGEVSLIVGADGGNSITGVKVLSHRETPGLGTKALEAGYLARYTGKKQAGLKLKKDSPSDGEIDAVTGATITSRAVAAAVSAALRKMTAGADYPVTQASPARPHKKSSTSAQ